MNIAYLHVTDGKQTVLLRRSRSSIDKPFAYEIVDGSLLQTDMRLEIQANAYSERDAAASFVGSCRCP
jgi:hypothetical protein